VALFVHGDPTSKELVFMLNVVRTSAFVVLAVAGGALAVACSSVSSSTFIGEPTTPDAEDGPISVLVPEASVEAGAEAGPVSCDPAIPAGFAPSWTPPTKASACSEAQLKAYYASCLANAGKTEADGTCAAWKADAANQDCAACAEPANKSGPIQWHSARKFFTLNVAGCLAVQQGKPEAGECGEAYNAAVTCARESCEGCFAIGGTFEQFRECQKKVASEGICKSYESTQSTKCQGVKTAGSDTILCFNDGAETQETHFTRVIGLLCGQ